MSFIRKMQIGNQNANQIQNIEGNIENFNNNASFAGNVQMVKEEIEKEVEEIYQKNPQLKEIATEFKKEIKTNNNPQSIFEKFEKFTKTVKKIASTEESVKQLFSLGKKIGSLLALLI